MTDCLNEGIRDQLPLLAHGTLAAAEVAAVRAHVSACAACQAELELLARTRGTLDASTPRVDTAAIVAMLPAPRLRVVAGGAMTAVAPRKRGNWMPRRYIVAAASLLIVASLASPLIKGAFDEPSVVPGPDTSVAVVTPESANLPAPISTAGLSVAAGLGDLSDDDLNALLAELEGLEATVGAEPTTIRTPIVSLPEGI